MKTPTIFTGGALLAFLRLFLLGSHRIYLLSTSSSVVVDDNVDADEVVEVVEVEVEVEKDVEEKTLRISSLGQQAAEFADRIRLRPGLL
ncbi:hypothetical protein TRV_06938 [Trichophyton verrucosum HKI 0517]|uniref:Uncharacterized protein n=1 Tax=Trichophyton verrucosum (strain HKI 0517) TaxID=663202 RepID=D4DID0_TRIVH|nr:uncharacterized protein TRV_06938 [Trichophyton verrucosum HKI 0517]EFE38392.1 hypothetical protein TRV_06938 [Trichophyton verrucosum HKI 0517]